ncbi:ribonuclease domain-containing protein [Nocardioides sp. NPDC006273]|uniref:ribonuclease domain-containing protein n=1 Tax=Nocardioides sp. NPDC006273 TaxID=3155598 RepID=UPI00339E5FE9
MRSKSALVGLLLALLMALVAGCGGSPGSDGGAKSGTDPESGLAWIAESDLPPEGAETLELIDAGGPFPYPGKDGSTFGNREGILPEEASGYYAEYTVPTPGSDDRGARRIVAGEGGEFYYTEDHYESFSRIDRG